MSLESNPRRQTMPNSSSETPPWATTVRKYVRVYKGDQWSFLQTFVPSRTPCPKAPTAKAFSEWALPGGDISFETSDVLHGLKTLVEDLPANRALSFTTESAHFFPFPFYDFVLQHTIERRMRILVPFPGKSVSIPDGVGDWRDLSMVVEMNYSREDDPYSMETTEQCERIISTARRAKNLMLATGLLAAFVVAIFGDAVRIARFDHAGAIVSQPLNLRSSADVEVLRAFFWRFVHPWEGEPGRVVGSDLTMRLFSNDDAEWLQGKLDAEVLDGVDLLEGRRVEVRGDEAGSRVFMLFKLIHVESRIFSRATMVWLAIEDTRGLDTPQEGSPTIVVVKEAWRRFSPQRWEKDCYDRLAAVPREELCGLPGLVCGDDLGQRELEEWKELDSPECPPIMLPAVLSTPGPLTAAFCAVASAFSSCDIPGSRLNESTAFYPDDPYPMHQTFTLELGNGGNHSDDERSHTRLVTDTVGRPLSATKSSKVLVMAIRDAIKGHRVAMERGGILHRDISPGNILLVDHDLMGSRSRALTGFLHDFDYSWLSKLIPGPGEVSVVPTEERESTHWVGTKQFFAQELLSGAARVRTVWHDLEAFYWLLVWMIMYYLPDYGGRMFDNCSYPEHPFSTLDPEDACWSKLAWLQDFRDTQIAENLPLGDLMTAYNALVLDGIATDKNRATGPTRLTYDSVLAVFDAAIARTDWPDDDSALDTLSDTQDSASAKSSPCTSADRTISDNRIIRKRKWKHSEGEMASDDSGYCDGPVVDRREVKRCRT